MTPEQVKQAARLVDEMEFLEELAINVGRPDLKEITLKFRSRGDMPITEPVMRIIRSGIEQALAEEMARCRQELEQHYNVRVVA
jgi:hypothetical protein